MSRRIVNITLDNLGDLPPKCRKCVFWELGPASRARAEENGDPELEKESWVSSVLLEWGSCGKIAYVAIMGGTTLVRIVTRAAVAIPHSSAPSRVATAMSLAVRS